MRWITSIIPLLWIANSKSSRINDYYTCDFNCTRPEAFVNVNTTHLMTTFIPQVEDALPLAAFVILAVMHGIVSLFAVAGNLIVIIVVVRSPRLKNVTNYFISNMALADVLIAIFSIPFQFQAAALGYWPLPAALCVISPFFQSLTVSASVFTLLAIAFDRFCAIVRPLRRSSHISKSTAKAIILIIWIAALILALPNALFFRTAKPNGYLECLPLPVLKNGTTAYNLWKAYSCAAPLVQYLFPLLILSYYYCRIGAVIWWSKIPGHALRERDALLLKNKKKVIKTLVLVVLLFALSWLPLQAFAFLMEIAPVHQIPNVRVFWLIINWLAMSNACHNPFIYGIVNKKYKIEFQRIFGQICPRGVCTGSENLRNQTGYTSCAMSEVCVKMKGINRSNFCSTSFEQQDARISTTQSTKFNNACVIKNCINSHLDDQIDYAELKDHSEKSRCTLD